MSTTILRLLVRVGILFLALSVSPTHAQTIEKATRFDLETTVVSELVVVAPAQGPAWWKASKGDSVVWILGLPPKTPDPMRWDQRALHRRLKGARLMLAPYVEWSGFEPGVAPPVLPPDLSEKVWANSRRMGSPMSRQAPITVQDAIHLRQLYYSQNRLGFGVIPEVYHAARRARVPMVTPPVYRHYWRASTVALENPGMAACIEGIIAEVNEPPKVYKTAAAYWAVGDVTNMLAFAPKGMGTVCERLWPGHWERTVAFQTNLIAQALEKPGKVVAAAHISQIVAKNGILQRLRAQGYTIADPSKPLVE